MAVQYQQLKALLDCLCRHNQTSGLWLARIVVLGRRRYGDETEKAELLVTLAVRLVELAKFLH